MRLFDDHTSWARIHPTIFDFSPNRWWGVRPSFAVGTCCVFCASGGPSLPRSCDVARAKVTETEKIHLPVYWIFACVPVGTWRCAWCSWCHMCRPLTVGGCDVWNCRHELHAATGAPARLPGWVPAGRVPAPRCCCTTRARWIPSTVLPTWCRPCPSRGPHDDDGSCT